MRRRLRDVGSRLSGARPAPRDEEPAAAAAVTDTTPDEAAAAPPTADDPTRPTTPEGAPVTTELEEPVAPSPDLVTDDHADAEGATEAVADAGGEPAVEADPLLAAAVDAARAVAVEVAGGEVGEHLGVEVDEARVVTHSFAALEKGYVGWRWAVTVARADGTDEVTVDEVVLLPGSGALLAPAWVPWSERIQPGDLSPGDLLPTAPDDPRLVPSFEDDEQQDLLFALDRELGLGREKVLSLEGRELAAERWWDGEAGPFAPLAKAAPAPCRTCGFLVPLAGGLSRAFGACANGQAPDDGRVVALGHGCGAHSSVVVDAAHAATTGLAVEEEDFELVAVAPAPAEDEAPLGHAPGSVGDADPAEPLGHS